MRDGARYLLTFVLVVVIGVVATPARAQAAGRCAQPVYTTAEQWGRWSGWRYTVDNDMWNLAGHEVSQTLTVCDQSSWYAEALTPRRTDREVKTYPNAHRDFHDWLTHQEPRLTAYRSLPVHWATRPPRAGRYDVAWDIWLDGVPGDDTGRVRTEVMVWTDNHGTVPSGHPVARARFGGRVWRVWRDSTLDHPYIAFVPGARLRHGSLDMMEPLAWLRHRGWLRRRATLGQVAFGYEVIATGGRRLHFATTGFAVDAVRRRP